MTREQTSKEIQYVEICLTGHVVGFSKAVFPRKHKEFCDQCGELIIIFCQNCGTLIQGSYGSYPGIFRRIFRRITRHSLWHLTFTPANYCPKCGEIYPWTEIKLNAAQELVDELEKLDDHEKEDLKQSIEDIVQNTPRKDAAIIRFKRLVKKAGPGVLDALKSILVDITSEAIRKQLFGS